MHVRLHDPTRRNHRCPASATRTVWPVAVLLLLVAPALHPQVIADLTITMSDGVLLEATISTPAGAVPPTGFPGIVFIHGYGGNKTDYATVAQYLTAQGYASLLYSVRGQGNSGGLSTTMGERERLDLQAVIRFFRSYAGIDPHADRRRRRLAGGGRPRLDGGGVQPARCCRDRHAGGPAVVRPRPDTVQLLQTTTLGGTVPLHRPL